MLYSIICVVTCCNPPSRSVASAEHSERASLDSRCSAEASVTSVGAAPGEVAIGNLIDITSLANGT